MSIDFTENWETLHLLIDFFLFLTVFLFILYWLHTNAFVATLWAFGYAKEKDDKDHDAGLFIKQGILIKQFTTVGNVTVALVYAKIIVNGSCRVSVSTAICYWLRQS